MMNKGKAGANSFFDSVNAGLDFVSTQRFLEADVHREQNAPRTEVHSEGVTDDFHPGLRLR
jgi:hypothetical protein